ncbi:MAG TPA: hypothetical protein VG694_02805 [Candidatus Paceibacterota bacterium]|jgi:hypothetical protein|nr:hypothetical protein [Candidatus Paceibacterota bacterium]
MKKIIHHIRKQPEHIRVKILYILTGISLLLLFVAWAHSFGVNVQQTAKSEKQLGENISPFAVLKDSAVSGFNSLKNSTPW